MDRAARHIAVLGGLLLLVLVGCTVQRPFHTDPVSPGIQSYAHDRLKGLPAPSEKIVAAVYRFRDQTGQYKPSDVIASWSTAVTQGATSILIKAMEDSGWFIPIEREGLSNLLNERQIIQQIRAQNAQGQAPQPLPPLLFAGIILEGGIVGYDTNILTGGMGARYLGTGAHQQFRKDQITIYLRAVSSQSGRVLKTIHTSKSIISYQLESGVFRYIDTNRLLEAEAGYTYNEPPVLAVTEAIDEALRLLVLEGIEEDLWAVNDSTELQHYLAANPPLAPTANQSYFGLQTEMRRSQGLNMGLSALSSSLVSNYANPLSQPGLQLEAQYYVNESRGWALHSSLFRTNVGAEDVFSAPLLGLDLLVTKDLLRQSYVTPFVGVGASALMYEREPAFLAGNSPFLGASLTAGLNYRLTERIDFRASYTFRYLLTDDIDGLSNSSVNDHLWNFQGGFILKNIF